MKKHGEVEILVAGAGIAGIATAYYLCCACKKVSVLLVDPRPPMSYTSAQSGDDYRNWWPHPTMTEFTNYSIDLMEEFASATSNVLNMTRRGYLLATRQDNADNIVADLLPGYQHSPSDAIRIDNYATTTSYTPADSNQKECVSAKNCF